MAVIPFQFAGNSMLSLLAPSLSSFLLPFFSRKHEGFLTSTGNANETNFTNGVLFESIN